MRLIDHKIILRDLKRLVISPVIIFSDDLSSVGERIAEIRLFPPYASPADGSCIGIQKDLRPVIQKPLFRAVGTIETVAVLRSIYVDIEDHHREDISDPEPFRKRDFHERLLRAVVKKQQRAASRLLGENAEIDAAAFHDGGSEGEYPADPVLNIIDLICRKTVYQSHMVSSFRSRVNAAL